MGRREGAPRRQGALLPVNPQLRTCPVASPNRFHLGLNWVVLHERRMNQGDAWRSALGSNCAKLAWHSCKPAASARKIQPGDEDVICPTKLQVRGQERVRVSPVMGRQGHQWPALAALGD